MSLASPNRHISSSKQPRLNNIVFFIDYDLYESSETTIDNELLKDSLASYSLPITFNQFQN